jgi:hypothetical protein
MKNPPATPPTFDEKLAQPCKPTRHEPTGRTYCFIQGNDLFSATGLYIASADKAPAPAAKN